MLAVNKSLATLKSERNKLYHHCRALVEEQTTELENRIRKLREDKARDTKSSAGDKFETARAMLQMEEEQTGRQLVTARQREEQLVAANRRVNKEEIGPGNLVVTKKARYYLAIGLGRVKMDEVDYLCVSTAAPIGQLLVRKRVGDELVFNGKKDMIMEIF